MAFVAVLLAFALTFTSVSVPGRSSDNECKEYYSEEGDHSNGRTAGDRREAEQDIADRGQG